jgi:peroxiredoxin/uncharacterized membrane protein YphA (DoxX/SURF4 family)
MSRSSSKSNKKIKDIATLIAGILIGITFLVSGTGKVLGLEEVPAQVVDFISSIVPSFFFTPLTISFLFKIFIPYFVPWAELILGLLLIIGFMPRLMSILCLPLLLAFMGTNSWSIIQGGYTECASCFGIWERIFGSLTPAQSLIYDAILLALAIVVIVLYPGTFLSSRKWLINMTQKIKPMCVMNLRKPVTALLIYIKSLSRIFQQHRSIAIGACFGIVGLALIVYGVTVLYSGIKTADSGKKGPELIASNIGVSEITSSGAVISWMTDKPITSNVIVYDENSDLIRAWAQETPATNHRVFIDGLIPNTLYYFEIVSGKTPIGQIPSKEHHFITLSADTGTPVIAGIHISDMTNNSAIIIWTTNKPATSEVEYCLENSPEMSTMSNAELNTNHRIELHNLMPDATYSFRVKSTDASGNRAVSETERTFTLAMGAEVGMRAPDFTLTSLDSKSITLSDYIGKIVFLDFWIWTCPGCREKLTIIQEVFVKMPPKKVAIFCIHVRGNESIIQNYATSENLTVPILLDPDAALAELYKVTGLPTVFVIDNSGFIRMIDPEFSNAEQLEDIFNTMLGTEQKPKSGIPMNFSTATLCCSSSTRGSL